MFRPSPIPAVSVEEAHARLSDPGVVPPLLVDVREPNEIADVRADGMVAMPLSAFMQRHRELPTDRPLLMICQSGNRSGQATAFLLANGWPEVANVTGGTIAWLRAGLPVRRGPLVEGEGQLPG